MSDLSEIQRIETAKAAVGQAPGGEIWLEEFLIRGQPGGGIKGAHVIYSWRAADAFGGKTSPQTMTPFPVTIAAQEAAFAAVADEIDLAALNTIAVREAQIAEMTQLLQTQSTEIGRLTAELGAAAETIQAANARIAELEAA